MIYIALPMCNVSQLIGRVIYHIMVNTENDYHLVMCDNNSTDGTKDIALDTIKEYWDNRLAKNPIFSMISMPSRVTALECTNQALSRATLSEYDMVVKMDHDYGVPPMWDSVILRTFEKAPQFKLLSPSVVPETPKGMQYYSAGHQPELVTHVDLEKPIVWQPQSQYPFQELSNDALKDSYIPSVAEVYHYAGIAGYCHCMRQSDFVNAGGRYNAMNHGAVFGSEDADWSLRCAPQLQSKGYIFNLQGWHWSKPNVGHLEDQYKGEATFLKTTLTLEEWMAENHPDVYENFYKVR